MGRRGPKSKAPGGVGSITAKGYCRIYDSTQRRLRMEHVLVWESVHGPVPPGFDVHHRDENKLNNAIDNLELLSKTAHKRVHGGCVLIDGVWWKPCPLCKKSKPVDAANWYLTKEGWPNYNRCRPCHIHCVVDAKRARRAKARSSSQHS